MAIEVSVRKEIKSYKEKLIFGFSIRQTISLAITILFDVSVGVLNYFFLAYSMDDLGLVLMFLSIPLLSIGWFQREGLPVEKYVKVYLNYRNLNLNYAYQQTGWEETIIELEDKKEKRKRLEYGN